MNMINDLASFYCGRMRIQSYQKYKDTNRINTNINVNYYIKLRLLYDDHNYFHSPIISSFSGPNIFPLNHVFPFAGAKVSRAEMDGKITLSETQ